MSASSLRDTPTQREGQPSVVFLPIVDVRGPNGVAIAAEAIVDTSEASALKPPSISGDRVYVASALHAARDLPQTFDLWFQVHAVTLSRDPEFLCFLGDAASATNVPLARLVIEIAEYAPEWADTGLTESLDALRHIGVRIAANEVGPGQADCRMILDCRPDYFKVDRYLVQGCHRDFYRRAVIESISMLASRFGARVIAKGVEYPLDLETLRSRGVELSQGSIFGPALEASQLPAFRPRWARSRRRARSPQDCPENHNSTEPRGLQ